MNLYFSNFKSYSYCYKKHSDYQKRLQLFLLQYKKRLQNNFKFLKANSTKNCKYINSNLNKNFTDFNTTFQQVYASHKKLHTYKTQLNCKKLTITLIKTSQNS